MTIEETGQLLAIIATVDNRNVTEETVLVWHELLAAQDYADVREAAMTHMRTSTEYITPALLLDRVRQTRFERYGYNVPAPDGQRWAVDVIESGEYDDDHQR